MNNMTKFLIATGVTAVGIGLTVYYAKKVQEKEEATEVVDDIEVEEKKDISFIEKIKTAATKKVVKILAWAVLHEQQLQAFATLLSVGVGIFHIVSAAKDYYRGEKLQNTLDSVSAHNEQFEVLWDNHMMNIENDNAEINKKLDELLAFKNEWNNEWNDHQAATNHNTQWFEKKLKDIHLDMGGIHQLQEALIPESV